MHSQDNVLLRSCLPVMAAFIVLLTCFICSSEAFAATSSATSIKYGWIALDANKDPVLAGTKYPLSGAVKPVAFITNGRSTVAVKDSAVFYLCNDKVGTGQALIVGKNIVGYRDAFITTFSIVESIPLTKATVSSIPDCNFTGKEQRPDPTVKISNQILAKDKDYTLSYKNNVNAGTATVTITGKGIYTGSLTKTFKIKPVEDKTLRLSKSKLTMLEGQKRITLKATIGSKKITAATSVTWSSSNSSVASVDKNGKVTALKKGTCYIKCTTSDNLKSSVKCKVTVKSGKDIVKEARKALGTKYVAKGHDWNKGMSCSGLVDVVYKRVLGVNWDPTTTNSHWFYDTNKFKTIKKSQLKPGDILVKKFKNKYGHVGIWTGNSIIEENKSAGKCIETKDKKQVDKWLKEYTARRYVG